MCPFGGIQDQQSLCRLSAALPCPTEFDIGMERATGSYPAGAAISRSEWVNPISGMAVRRPTTFHAWSHQQTSLNVHRQAASSQLLLKLEVTVEREPRKIATR